MTHATPTVLVVDSNAETRARVTRELGSTPCTVLEAEDGSTALEILRQQKVRLVVSELFLRTGENDCLIQAVRRQRVHGTRMLAHTVHGIPTSRDWARHWGASGFLIQPAGPERLRYVVSKLLAPRAVNTGKVRTSRRDTLNGALGEIERGELRGTFSIVLGRSWWEALRGSERNDYRRRARRSGVTLRADAMMSPDFVELREVAPRQRAGKQRAARPSPYRKPTE